MLSILLGLGLASLFHKACKDKECIKFSGPVIKQVDGKIFEHDGKCFQYDAKAVKCDATKKTLDFSHNADLFDEPSKSMFGGFFGSKPQ
jgi:hypothetical protein